MKKEDIGLTIMFSLILFLLSYVLGAELCRRELIFKEPQQDWQCVEWKNETFITKSICEPHKPLMKCEEEILELEKVFNKSFEVDCVILTSFCINSTNQEVYPCKCKMETETKQVCIKEGKNCKEECIEWKEIADVRVCKEVGGRGGPCGIKENAELPFLCEEGYSCFLESEIKEICDKTGLICEEYRGVNV